MKYRNPIILLIITGLAINLVNCQADDIDSIEYIMETLVNLEFYLDEMQGYYDVEETEIVDEDVLHDLSYINMFYQLIIDELETEIKNQLTLKKVDETELLHMINKTLSIKQDNEDYVIYITDYDIEIDGLTEVIEENVDTAKELRETFTMITEQIAQASEKDEVLETGDDGKNGVSGFPLTSIIISLSLIALVLIVKGDRIGV